jgi:N-acetylglutamate synthase-like GNAT family acetyltransferase
MGTSVRIEPAAGPDMPYIETCVRRLRLDPEDLRAGQFVVIRENGRIVAFGRIKPYRYVYELGSVGVVEEARGRGLGSRIVRELIARFPVPAVYITTDLPAYFARFGFQALRDPPPEIQAKLTRVCGPLRQGVVPMVFHRPD